MAEGKKMTGGRAGNFICVVRAQRGRLAPELHPYPSAFHVSQPGCPTCLPTGRGGDFQSRQEQVEDEDGVLSRGMLGLEDHRGKNLWSDTYSKLHHPLVTWFGAAHPLPRLGLNFLFSKTRWEGSCARTPV